MQSKPDTFFDLSNFSGTAPVFPLPNVVLFPHQGLPLRIFEPRYRAMMADALRGEKLIAMSLLKPGWENNYEGRPDTHEMVCIGRITAEERLSSGEYNLILAGVQRAVIEEELGTDTAYRVARLELFNDFYSKEPLVDREARRRDLLMNFRRLFTEVRADALFAQVLEADVPLGVLCDLLTAALPIVPELKQQVLDELDVDLRSDLVLARILELQEASQGGKPPRKFPPEFSLN
jgi:Lon protease-like protein